MTTQEEIKVCPRCGVVMLPDPERGLWVCKILQPFPLRRGGKIVAPLTPIGCGYEEATHA